MTKRDANLKPAGPDCPVRPATPLFQLLRAVAARVVERLRAVKKRKGG